VTENRERNCDEETDTLAIDALMMVRRVCRTLSRSSFGSVANSSGVCLCFNAINGFSASVILCVPRSLPVKMSGFTMFDPDGGPQHAARPLPITVASVPDPA
jgi:hypothetical protein